MSVLDIIDVLDLVSVYLNRDVVSIIRAYYNFSGIVAGEMKPHLGKITTLIPLGNLRCATTDLYCKICITDFATRIITILNSKHGHIKCLVALSNNRLVSGSTNGTIVVWDLSTSESEIIGAHYEPIVTMVALPDERLVSACNNGIIMLWDLLDKTAIILGHHENVNKFSLLPDGHLISIAYNQPMLRWDLKTRTSAKLSSVTYWGNNVNVVTDTYICVALEDNTIKVWDFRTDETFTLSGHTDSVNAIIALPDERIASCSCDHTIRIWDFTKTSPHRWVCFATPNERWTHPLFVDTPDNLYDINETLILKHDNVVIGMAALPNNRLIAHLPDILVIWDLLTFKSVVVDITEYNMRSLLLVNDDYLITPCRNGRIVMWV